MPPRRVQGCEARVGRVMAGCTEKDPGTDLGAHEKRPSLHLRSTCEVVDLRLSPFWLSPKALGAAIVACYIGVVLQVNVGT